MQTHCLITGTGKDRVGIVADLSELLFEHGCNLLDSSMMKLRGEFAMILMVSLPADQLAQLDGSLKRKQGSLGLTLTLRELTPEELSEPVQPDRLFVIRLLGADRTGIVAQVSRLLSQADVNITDVQTKLLKQDSRDVFAMILECTAPPSLSEKALQEHLRPVAGELNVEVTVEEVEVLEL